MNRRLPVLKEQLVILKPRKLKLWSTPVSAFGVLEERREWINTGDLSLSILV